VPGRPRARAARSGRRTGRLRVRLRAPAQRRRRAARLLRRHRRVRARQAHGRRQGDVALPAQSVRVRLSSRVPAPISVRHVPFVNPDGHFARGRRSTPRLSDTIGVSWLYHVLFLYYVRKNRLSGNYLTTNSCPMISSLKGQRTSRPSTPLRQPPTPSTLLVRHWHDIPYRRNNSRIIRNKPVLVIFSTISFLLFR